MRDDPSVVALVNRVLDGDQEAWNEVVERYAPLVWSICVRHRLSRQDIDDVGQTVWLLAIENITGLREKAALAGWLAKLTRHECLRVLDAARKHDAVGLPADGQLPPYPSDKMIEDEIIAAERNAALRAAFAELPADSRCYELLSLLIRDPPLAYAEISSTLGRPVGWIGPTRGRCLEQLRRSPHLASLLDSEQTSKSMKPEGEHRGR